MNELRLALVQSNLRWQQAAENRRRLETTLGKLTAPADLIILPEMFTSAFSMEAGAFAEAHPGETLDWMLGMARHHQAAITGSIAVTEAGQRFNRLLFVTPEQQVWHYDKRHLFRMLGEHERYSPGRERVLVPWRGWRILPLVCYDLRFPVWCRNTGDAPYDLLLFVANWPAARGAQWSRLLCARAIENLSYVAGVNRVGTDGKDIAYDGRSAVYDAQGETLLHAGGDEGVFQCTIRKDELEAYRDQFPAHMDADRFTLQ